MTGNIRKETLTRIAFLPFYGFASFRYGSGYSLEHPVIRLFWEVVAGFPAHEQALLLKFVTACSRPPLLGFKYLEPKFCIQKAGSGGDEDAAPGNPDHPAGNGQSSGGGGAKQSRLPTAATCMNLLKLPPYATKAEMEEKIRYAINAGAGFELS